MNEQKQQNKNDMKMHNEISENFCVSLIYLNIWNKHFRFSFIFYLMVKHHIIEHMWSVTSVCYVKLKLDSCQKEN